MENSQIFFLVYPSAPSAATPCCLVGSAASYSIGVHRAPFFLILCGANLPTMWRMYLGCFIQAGLASLPRPSDIVLGETILVSY